MATLFKSVLEKYKNAVSNPHKTSEFSIFLTW